MRRAGIRARREARKRTITFIRARWKATLVLFVASASVPIVGRFLLRPFMPSTYQLDLFTAVVTGVVFTASFFLIRDLDLSKRFRDGSDAEQFSSSALRKLKRFNYLPPINGVDFEGFDVDHVLIGPGGAWAFETKWTSGEWEVAGGRLVGPVKDPISQARESAKKINLFLNVSKRLEVPVAAALIIWGPGTPHLEKGYAEIANVLVLSGPDRKKWMQRFANEPKISQAKAVEAYQELQNYVDQRTRFERERLGRSWRYYARLTGLTFFWLAAFVLLLIVVSIARVILSA